MFIEKKSEAAGSRIPCGRTRLLIPQYGELLRALNAMNCVHQNDNLLGKKCWLYARVDSGGVDAHVGLDAQMHSLKRYADAHRMQIVGTTDEVMSGVSLNRDGLNHVLKAAAANQMDVLLVRGYDRISRNTDFSRLAQFIANLNQLGVEIIPVEH